MYKVLISLFVDPDNQQGPYTHLYVTNMYPRHKISLTKPTLNQYVMADQGTAFKTTLNQRYQVIEQINNTSNSNVN